MVRREKSKMKVVIMRSDKRIRKLSNGDSMRSANASISSVDEFWSGLDFNEYQPDKPSKNGSKIVKVDSRRSMMRKQQSKQWLQSFITEPSVDDLWGLEEAEAYEGSKSTLKPVVDLEANMASNCCHSFRRRG